MANIKSMLLPELTAALKEDCRLELLDMRSPYGNMCYQSSLSLIYLEAVHHDFVTVKLIGE